MTRVFCTFLLLALLFLTNACLPAPPSEGGGANITLYGFSIMKEALEKDIYPAFVAKWKKEHGQDTHFTSSFAGSETITNQILQGVGADVAILSIERDAKRLKDGGATTTDWTTFPNKGIINKTPFVILVRKGNPKGIKDFADLAKPGVRVIHPDPVSSGGAQWSILAIYGSEIVKTKKQGVGELEGNLTNAEIGRMRGLELLKSVWKNVISTPGSAREARTQFETGSGDALITYELEGLLMKQANAQIDIVVPESTIFSEHPVVIVDRNVNANEKPVIQAFINFLWTEEAQKAFVKYHFRSVTDEKLNASNKEFAEIKMPFTIELFGGWDRAYPEIIEGVWRKQVQTAK